MKKKLVWLPYDFDTAIGINNEGNLVFSYNLEDTDLTDEGSLVFNGQESVMWTNLRDAFGSEIAAMYKNLRSSDVLSYDVVEEMFESHQAKWSEAIFNEDSWRKYIRPLVEENDETYLGMLQGSKAEQRKWWLFNRFRYMDSKFNAGDALGEYIELRLYDKSNITVIPYADIYPSVLYASHFVQKRGKRLEPTVLECPITGKINDAETYIYSADQLASVGDLSGFKVGRANFSSAVRLQNVKLGDAASTYDNPNLGKEDNRLTFGNNVLLRTIDVRNCSGLGTGTQKSVDISHCSNVEEVYFDGTKISGLDLPNGGVLKKLHLPGTITNLTIRNQTNLSEFVLPNYTNITTLVLENIPETVVNYRTILNSIADGSRIRLIGFYWECEDSSEIDTILGKLDKMRGLDETLLVNMDTAQISGTIHTAALTGSQISDYNSRYPYLKVIADHTTSYLYYYNYDGSSLLYTETIIDGADGAYTGTPSRSSDAQYNYTFAGWSTMVNGNASDDARKGIMANRNVYAAYSKTVRTYTVTFVNNDGSTLLTLSNIAYGTTPSYTGSTPTYSGSDAVYFTFNGWSPVLGPISGATTYRAQYLDARSNVIKYLQGTLTAYESDTNNTVAPYAFYQMTSLESVKAPLTSIGKNAFDGCTKLATVELNSNDPVNIDSSAFSGASLLKALIIRSKTKSSLFYTNGLQNTPILKGEGAVYVPSDLIETYKSDSRWKNVPIIASIDDYPLTDFGTIKDSFAQINAACNDGTYATKYAIGDTKTIDCGDEGVILAELRGIDVDDKADGSGKAKLTFVFKGMLKTTKQMNSTATTTGGYDASGMKTYVNNDIWPLLPDDLKSIIVAVTKVSSTYENGAVVKDGQTTTEKLWLLSDHEAGLGNTYETTGPVYFSSASERIKYNQSGSAYYWWLRSANYAGSFRCVNYNGYGYSNNAGSTYGVVLGFCIG